MAKDPAALLYIDKWIVATTEMKADCRAYYMDMILFQFDKGSLPNDIEEIANICRVRISEFKSFEHVFEHVLKSKFKLNSEGRLENEFAKEIIQGRQQFLDKRSSSGRMSYFIRFIIKNFKPKKDVIQFVKDNADLSDIDLKNEQLLKHLFEHLLELYINVNEDEDKDVIDTKKGVTGGKQNTFNFKKSLLEIGVTEKIASDWLVVRKNKKASNTETAFKSIKKQIEISGRTANDCIEIAVNKSWSGFEASWLLNLSVPGKQKEML